MKKVFVLLFCAVLVVVLLAMGIWFYAIPDDYVVHQIEQLNLHPLQVEINGFSKGLFFSFRADNLTVRNSGADVVGISDIRGKIHPLKLIAGRVVMEISGAAYGGTVKSILRLSKGNASAEVKISGVDIGSIATVRDLGLKGGGTLSGTLFFKNNSGTLQCLVNNASFSGFNSGGIFVPMNYFSTVRCAVDIISPGNFSVKSVSLEGKGIFARVKGSIRNRYADLNVEIMPEADFKDSSILMLLNQYKVSEGYYLIPLKTRL